MNAHLGLVLLVLAFSTAGQPDVDQPPCQLAGEWIRADHVQTVELYQSGSHWFGRLVSSSEKDAKPGFVMFKDFVYDTQRHQFKGTVLVPTSGMQASADLVCMSDRRFKVTAHKFFITRSFEFSRVESR